MRHSAMKGLAIVAVLIVAAAVLAAWMARSSGKGPIRVTVIVKATEATYEFWRVLTDGAMHAAEEFNVEVDIWGPPTEQGVDEQVALLEKAIAEKPDAIVLAATDYNRLVPAAEKAERKGIKLVIVDSGIASDSPLSVVATDNYKAGQETGRALLRHIEVPAKIALFNFVKNAGSLLERERGVRSVLENTPGLEVLETYYADGSEETAYSMAKRALQEHPDVGGIVGLNEPTAVGAGRAIKDLNLQGKVKLIGFDSSISEIKLLEEGVMQATVIQRPFQMGYLSLKTAVDAVRGKKVPPVIDTESLLITKENMYEEENQKLLFPFVG